MNKTAQIVDFKRERDLRKGKPLLKEYRVDFSKFYKLYNKIKRD